MAWCLTISLLGIVTGFTAAAEDVFHYYPIASANECGQMEVCGAMGRQPCSDSGDHCGECINGFVPMDDDPRVCRRIRPGDRLESTNIVTALNPPDTKRAALGSNEPPARAASLTANDLIADLQHEHSSANHHTKIFILLVAFAITGIVLAGLLGLGYHKYSVRELKLTRGSGNNEVSYGVAGNDDVSEEKEMARKAQIYHYQHQKRIISSMNQAAAAAATTGQTPSSVVVGGNTNTDGSAVSPTHSSDQSPMSEGSANQVSAAGLPTRPTNDESEEELDPDFTVYECPGLAPSGEMEVKNPLFDNEGNMTADEEEEE